ncbi:uncharacterized protein [Elaeis guineensis]|uniref:uncharacterized protein n=1 Tax=Elaeis guineensis var. tenera TaxID=51953 RepID=UPI003C6D33EA
MDHYFGWYEMSEARRVRFARMKLVRQARLYWESVECLLNQRRQDPIETWDEMKEKLREKYLPTSYQQRLLDQWQRFTQGNRLVIEYIARFDEYLMRCGVAEDRVVTLSRFRAGLREDIQRELFLREVTTLEQAYQLALDLERFSRYSILRRPEPSRVTPSGSRPNINQTLSNGPPLTNSIGRKEDKGKGAIGELSKESSSRFYCFKYHGYSHFAAQFPNRSLIIEELEGETLENIEEEVYEADPDLVEQFESTEDILGYAAPESDLRLGVVRYVLAQTKKSEDWRRISIFHTFIKFGDKIYKMIIDSGSCINAISTDTIKRLGLTPVDHPSPYTVSWIDSSSIPIKFRCHVLI